MCAQGLPPPRPQLGTLPSGMALRVVSHEAGWVQIANGDGSQTGWIYERPLEPTVAPSEQGEGSAELAEAGQQQQDQSEWVRVSGSPATMRSGPSDSAPMMFGFPEGRRFASCRVSRAGCCRDLPRRGRAAAANFGYRPATPEPRCGAARL
jgi:hypothetical protein